MKKDAGKEQISEVNSTYRVDAATGHSTPGNGQPFDEPVSEAGKRVSEEDYWDHYYKHPDFSYEWNDGILEEKPVSDAATIAIYYWFLTLLYAYLQTHPVAKVAMLEFGVRLALPHRTSIRKPDFFIVREDNPRPLNDVDRSYRGICDLAVEALSDSTRREKERDTVVKYAEYEGIGIREYYILHTAENNLGFYRLNEANEYEPILPTAEGVIQSTVLPGFQFRLADLLHRPSLIDMAKDPVYQAFVLPEHTALQRQMETEQQLVQAEKQRADAEKQRAETEKQRADAEKQRADRLAARLRALGIDEDDV